MKPHRFAVSWLARGCATTAFALITAAPLASPAAAQEGKDKASPPADTTKAGAAADTTKAGAAADSVEGASAWSVQGPTGGRWTLRSGRDYEIVVTAGDEPLKGLALVGSTLQNEETGARVNVSAIRLCRVDGRAGAQRDTLCAQDDSIPARATVPLELRIDAGRSVPAGAYVGALSFAADGGEGVKQLQMKVESTSWWRRLLGALAIALGVFLSWLMTVAFRQANTHYAAKLAAARLVATLADLRKRAEKAVRTTGFPLDRLLAQIRELEGDLEPESLKDHGLPRLVANPFTSGQDGGDVFEGFRKEKETRIQVLGVIVRTGVAGAESAWHTMPDVDKERIRTAMAELDEAATAPLDLAAAKTRVEEILTAMRTPPPMASGFGPSSRGAAVLPSARELEVRLERISLAGWGISLVLTVLVGMVVLVLPNYGFGTAMDFVKCLFWGLGLPFVTQKIQELGPTNVQSTLKVSVPS
jgi:hypothetical protein